MRCSNATLLLIAAFASCSKTNRHTLQRRFYSNIEQALKMPFNKEYALNAARHVWRCYSVIETEKEKQHFLGMTALLSPQNAHRRQSVS